MEKYDNINSKKIGTTYDSKWSVFLFLISGFYLGFFTKGGAI